MNNLREVNNDILKDWLVFREETFLAYTNAEDRKHQLNFDEICENIMRNVPDKNKKKTRATLKEHSSAKDLSFSL